MVKQTLGHNQRVLPKPQAECWVYLRESAKCLIFGLSQASVALSRAAMESCLRETYADWFGKGKADESKTTLGILIDDLSRKRPVLSQKEAALAREVKDAGDKVLHSELVEAEKAMSVFKAAREAIRSVTAKARR